MWVNIFYNLDYQIICKLKYLILIKMIYMLAGSR